MKTNLTSISIKKFITMFLIFIFSISLYAGVSQKVRDMEKTLVPDTSKSYSVTGYFAYYDFGEDSASNWTFTFAGINATYRLLGDTSDENIQKMGVFGWTKVDVTPNDPQFYMVRFGQGSFDWVLFSVDDNGNCTGIYKLAGQDQKTKTFSYDVDGDGKTDILSDLTCKLEGDTVTFYDNSYTIEDNITDENVTEDTTVDVDTPPSIPDLSEDTTTDTTTDLVSPPQIPQL